MIEYTYAVVDRASCEVIDLIETDITYEEMIREVRDDYVLIMIDSRGPIGVGWYVGEDGFMPPVEE